MSNQVVYVVYEEGNRFNHALDPEYRLSNQELQTLRETGSLCDGRLAGNPQDFSIELTGLVTIIWLPVKYSRFLYNDSERRNILAWEQEFATISPNARKVRVDEFLLGKWEATADEFWFRDADAVKRFFEWLEDQDPNEWSDI